MQDGWMEGDRIGDDVGDGVRGDGVCLGRGVGGRGRVARLEVIGGREIFGKEGKGDRGFAENSGAWILKRGKGKQYGSWRGEVVRERCKRHADARQVIMGVAHYHGNVSLQDLRVSEVLKVGSGTCVGTGK
jgi:hypothetical protein